MLMVGEFNTFVNIVDSLDPNNTRVYNLSSAAEYGEKLNILPPFSANYADEREFDINFANYIFSNDNVFFEFMKVILNLYIGRDVIILVTQGNQDYYRYFDMVTEALTKIIQQRYGYIHHSVNCPEDFFLINRYNEPYFDIKGLYNLGIDKERFMYLDIKKAQVNQFGEPIIPEGQLFITNI